MPTIQQRLHHFYDGLGVYFRFSKTQVKKLSNQVKRRYDGYRKREPDQYPEPEYVTSRERNRELRVRNYPPFFAPVIDVLIKKTYDQYVSNVLAEKKLGNMQPLRNLIGDLPRITAPKNPVYRGKRGDGT